MIRMGTIWVCGEKYPISPATSGPSTTPIPCIHTTASTITARVSPMSAAVRRPIRARCPASGLTQ